MRSWGRWRLDWTVGRPCSTAQLGTYIAVLSAACPFRMRILSNWGPPCTAPAAHRMTGNIIILLSMHDYVRIYMHAWSHTVWQLRLSNKTPAARELDRQLMRMNAVEQHHGRWWYSPLVPASPCCLYLGLVYTHLKIQNFTRFPITSNITVHVWNIKYR